MLDRLEDRTLGARRFPHRLDVRLRVQHAPETAADDRMIVDHEHADGHLTGTSATSVAPAPRRGLDAQSSTDEPHPLAHPDETQAAVGRQAGIEAGSVILDDDGDRSLPLREQDADAARAGMLDDVVQRLLGDPVKGRLYLTRQPFRAEARLEVDPHLRLFTKRLDEALERRDEPEVVERRWPQLDREPANVLERRDDELPQRSDSRPSFVAC